MARIQPLAPEKTEGKTRTQLEAVGKTLAAHAVLGAGTGLDDAAILSARRGEAADPRTAAVFRFAAAVVDTRGGVSDATPDAARAAGLGDGELVEIVAHVALNVLTNYVNRVAGTDVDFLRAPTLAAQVA